MGNSPSESADYPDGVSVDVDVDPHQDRIRDRSSVAATSQQMFYHVEATVEKQVQQTAVATFLEKSTRRHLLTLQALNTRLV